jgi:hypothetical protein
MAHKGAKAGKFEVRIEGADALEKNMNDIADRLVDGKVFMAEGVEMMQTASIERWRSHPWAPEAQSTQERKAREGASTEILRGGDIEGGTLHTARKADFLYNAVNTPHAPGQTRRITKTSATFGLAASGTGPLFYARFVSHVKVKEKDVRRRILAMNPATVALITRRYRDYVMGWKF